MSSLQNIPDNEGTTPLHYAAQAGHVEVVSFLLTKAQSTRIEKSRSEITRAERNIKPNLLPSIFNISKFATGGRLKIYLSNSAH